MSTPAPMKSEGAAATVAPVGGDGRRRGLKQKPPRPAVPKPNLCCYRYTVRSLLVFMTLCTFRVVGWQ